MSQKGVCGKQQDLKRYQLMIVVDVSRSEMERTRWMSMLWSESDLRVRCLDFWSNGRNIQVSPLKQSNINVT